MKRLLAWLFADLVIDLFGVEDRILARLKQQEDEIWPEMFAKLEGYLTERIVAAMTEQSIRIVSRSMRATTPLDEPKVLQDE